MPSGVRNPVRGPPRCHVADQVRRRRRTPGEGDARARAGRLDEGEGGAGARCPPRRRRHADRKPKRRTFSDLADEFEAVAPGDAAEEDDDRRLQRRSCRTTCAPVRPPRPRAAVAGRRRRSSGTRPRRWPPGLAPKTVRNHLVLAGLMFKTARSGGGCRRTRSTSSRPRRSSEHRDGDADAAVIADLLAAYRSWRTTPTTTRSRGSRLQAHDDGRALHGPQTRRAARAAMAGRRAPRAALIHVRQQFVRNEITTPKSRAGRRRFRSARVAARCSRSSMPASLHRAPESIVFSHPALGTPLDPSKLTTFARKALARAGIPKPFRPWHGLRHTALTETAAAGVPAMFVQAKAGHAQGSTTERYLTRTRRATRTRQSSPKRGCSVPSPIPRSRVTGHS